MARFNTVMIETGTAIVDDTTGQKTVSLESPFTGTPTVSLTIAPNNLDSSIDPGSDLIPSYNANAYITGLGKASGVWTFVINTQPLNIKGSPAEALDENGDVKAPAHKGIDTTKKPEYKSIQFIYRAIGPVSAT